MNSQKHVDIERVGKTLVVSLSNELGSLSDEQLELEFRSAVEQAAQPEVKNLVVDIERATYFGSQVLEWMVVLWKRIREKQGRMAFANASPTALEILKVARFDTLWPIHDSREQALRSLGESPAEP